MDSYLIAITPPLEVCKKVDVYRQKYAKYSGYKIPPHITLCPPFTLETGAEEDMFLRISRSLKKASAEELVFDSIGFFANKADNNVAFFKPKGPSTEYLRELFAIIHSGIGNMIANKYDHHSYSNDASHFNPHMTIAAQIPNDEFEGIQNALKNSHEVFRFIVKSIDLYLQKDGLKTWEMLRKIDLLPE